MHYCRHSVNYHTQDESVPILSSKHKYVHLKTHLASHTMHLNFTAVQLQHKYFYSIDPRKYGTACLAQNI